MHPHSLSLSLRLPLLSLLLSAHPFFPSPANSSLSSPSSPPPLLPSTQPTPLSMTHIISPQLFRARDCYGQQQPLHSSLMHVEVSLRLCLFRTLLFFCCCCCFAFVYPLSEFPSDSPLSGSAREKKKVWRYVMLLLNIHRLIACIYSNMINIYTHTSAATHSIRFPSQLCSIMTALV